MHRNLGGWLLLAALLTALVLLWVQLRRDLPRENSWKRTCLWIAIVASAIAAVDCIVWVLVDRDSSVITRQLRESRSWDLRGADLRDAILRGADLRRARLDRADLTDADLTKAKLRGADLERANLRGAILFRADLREADLEDAQLDCALLAETRFAGATFENVDFSYSIGASPALVDTPYRADIPQLPEKREDVPETCRQHARVMRMVEDRIDALERRDRMTLILP